MRLYIIIYIVMKPTLRNSVKEVYKKSNKNNNNYGFNNNFLNNNNNTSNNININNSQENNKNNAINNKFENSQSPIFNINTILIIIFFIIIASIIGAVIYFKDSVLDFIKNTFFKEETEKTEQEINDLKNELEENKKNKLLIEQELEILRKQKVDSESNETNDTTKQKEESNKESKKIKKSIKTNEELRKLYSDNQFVKEDGFCYIGSDNNMRQCVEVYNGDICESGDVYKRIDDCLMPSHFKN